MGLYQPGGAIRRVTSSRGVNAGWIRGGKVQLAAGPVFIGPAIANQVGTVGVAFSLATAPFFSGGGLYSKAQGAPYLTVNINTGLLSGTPTQAGVTVISVRKTKGGDQAVSNQFTLTVT